MAEHYFTDRPSSPSKAETLAVHLAGREISVTTAGGVFSGSRVDPGTEVLLRHTPKPPESGDLLDLGCGWGPIALTLAMLAPAARVWAVDVNQRALELTASNAAALGCGEVRTAVPDEVPAELRFATIWSNPPIRVGKSEVHGLLSRWLPRLEVGGSAYLVVHKHLGADSLHTWLENDQGFSVERVGSTKGYRVLRVGHPTP